MSPRPRQQVQQRFHWSSRGGRREGAGRKRKTPKLHSGRSVPHLRRQPVAARYPIHVIIRCALQPGESLRRFLPHLRFHDDVLRRLHQKRPEVGVVAYSVQSNHLHLIVEADGPDQLRSGLHSLCIRTAKQLNRAFGRRGRLFSDRHQRIVLKTPTQVRSALAYVLLNFRHHLAKQGRRLGPGRLDPYSSAMHFDGWTRSPAPIEGVAYVATREPPVAAPRTALCQWLWRRRGLISPDEIPGHHPPRAFRH